MTQTGIRRPTYATPADAVAKARGLAPGIRARVRQAEELRRLPDETIRELMDSGLFLLLAPRAMGGSELNYDAVLDVTIVLSEACPSTGWVYALLAAHMWLLAEFPEHIQSEVFNSPNPLACSCVSTVGTPVRVEGGYRWTGRGFFSSGCDHSDWLIPSMLTPSDDGTSERRWFILPGSDFEIVDDWFTMGLRGTGSKTVMIDDAFIPDERVLRIKDLSCGTAPGARALLMHDVYKYCFSEASNFSDLEKARCRRDTSYAAQLCRQAVNRLFEAAGGSGLYDSSDMQRLWRDTNAAAAHHGLTWDVRGLEYGRVMMGLPATPEQATGSVL